VESGYLSQGPRAKCTAVYRGRHALRRRAGPGRHPGGRVLRGDGGYRLQDRLVQRHVRAQPHVRLHFRDDGGRRCVHGGHPLGGANGIPLAHWNVRRVMADVDTVSAPHAAVSANEDLGEITRRTFWEANEKHVLGTGFIVLTLLIWEATPYIVTFSRGMQMFFTTPSAIAVKLYEMFATGMIWPA